LVLFQSTFDKEPYIAELVFLLFNATKKIIMSNNWQKCPKSGSLQPLSRINVTL